MPLRARDALRVGATMLAFSAALVAVTLVASLLSPHRGNKTPSRHPCNLVPSIGATLRVETRRFSNASCAHVERCIDGVGARRLLRFDLVVSNRGRGNLLMGDPRAHPRDFEFSPCHGHYHFEHFSHYYLVDAANATVARGHKQSYCLRDSRRDAPVDDADAPGHFSCTRQGISAGHSDVYGAHLDCQWIDISDVAVPGTYWIVAVVFPVFNETRYDDNTARRRVELR